MGIFLKCESLIENFHQHPLVFEIKIELDDCVIYHSIACLYKNMNSHFQLHSDHMLKINNFVNVNDIIYTREKEENQRPTTRYR